MGLQFCPECNGMVSSYAHNCPHCGCPMELNKSATEWNTVVFRGKTLDASRVMSLMKINGMDDIEVECANADLCMEQGISSNDMDELLQIIAKKFAEVAQYVPAPVQKDQNTNMPKCPTCGSIDLTKIGVGTRAIDGLVFGRLSVEGRAQFRCNKCGYVW